MQLDIQLIIIIVIGLLSSIFCLIPQEFYTSSFIAPLYDIQSAMSNDETFIFIAKNRDLIPVFIQEENPCIVFIPNKSKQIKTKLDFHKNLFLFVKNVDEVGFLLDNLQSSELWNNRTSPRGRYFVFFALNQMYDAKNILNTTHEKNITNTTYEKSVLNTTYAENIINTTYEKNILNTTYEENILNITYAKNIFNSIYHAKEIFFEFWRRKILDLKVVTTNGSDWEISTGNFCSFEDVGKEDFKLIRDFNLKFNLPDLSGCVFQAGLVNIMFEMPYIGNIKDPEPGLFLRPLKLISEKLHLRIDYIIVPRETQMEYLKRGGEVRHKIYEAARDVYVSCANRYQHYYEHFDLTDVFFYDFNNWLIAKPNRLSNVKVLAAVFKLESWVLVVCVYLIVALIWRIMSIFVEESTEGFMGLFQVSLGVGMPSMPVSETLRLLLIFIDYYFIGKLSSILTSPGLEKGIRSVEEMSRSDQITPFTYIGMKKSFLTLDSQAAKMLANKSQPILKSSKTDLFEIMAKHKNISVTAYTAEFTSNYRPYFDVLGRNFLLGMEASYGLKKGHLYLTYFNYLINAMFEAGLQNKWLADIIGPMKIGKNNGNESEQVVLTVKHLQAAFLIFLVGTISSIVVFVLELIYKNVRRSVIIGDFKYYY